MYQNREGDKGNEGEGKKERKNFPSRNKRKRPFHGTRHLVYFNLKKRTGKMQKNQ